MEKRKVLCGIDRISDADKFLRGNKIALLTAASGVNKEGIPTYEILSRKYRLEALFAPEHGLYSALQDGGFDSDKSERDSESGEYVYNLTGSGHPRLDGIISGIDIAVYDIQDVGARFYTYLCNLTQIMRACAKNRKPLLVLDRPSPCTGLLCEGGLLDESRFSSFIGEFSIPIRYAMTVGEYAEYVNVEKNIGCELYVLECEGWHRDMYYDDSDLLFVNPSPNIPSVDCILNYYGSCIYEATNISEGRGTTRPFDMVGAPFVDSKTLYDEMCSYRLPGVIFRRVSFTPQFNKYAGEVCHGLQLHITDRNAYRPVLTMMYMLNIFRRYKEYREDTRGICLRFGNEDIIGEFDPEKVYDKNAEKIREFLSVREKYLRYS